MIICLTITAIIAVIEFRLDLNSPPLLSLFIGNASRFLIEKIE
ncbi:MAG: hypothetical protein Q7S22_01945 [Candidatus Micrarchaeota archaeon]|nr:hypothetical protein [Candidatus Micrarchaeota archaeon]